MIFFQKGISQLCCLSKATHLLRRQNLEGVGNLLLPREAVLAVNLSSRAKVLAALREETCAQDDLVVAKSGLVVVDVGLIIRILGSANVLKRNNVLD